MLSPAYGYSQVNDREIFMTREDVQEKFKDIDKLAQRFRLSSTPTYLDFLKAGGSCRARLANPTTT